MIYDSITLAVDVPVDLDLENCHTSFSNLNSRVQVVEHKVPCFEEAPCVKLSSSKNVSFPCGVQGGIDLVTNMLR